MTPEDFAGCLVGPPSVAATEALLGALADFSPDAAQRKYLTTVAEKAVEAARAGG